VVNTGGGTNHQVFVGYSGDITFNDDVDISNGSDATNSAVYLGNNTSDCQLVFNGNLNVESTNAAADGVYVLPQSATVAAGKTVNIKSGGYIAGYLYLRNITQQGSAAVSLNLTGSSVLYIYDDNWGGTVNFKSPRIYTR